MVETLSFVDGLKETPMKILHINCNYYGSGLHRNLADALLKHDIYSSFFVPIPKRFRDYKNEEGVFPAPCYNKLDRLFYFVKQLKIYRALEKNAYGGADFTYANTLFSDGNISLKIKKDAGIPYVVAVRNTDINAYLRYKPWLLHHGIKILEEAEAIIFISKKYKDKFFEKYIRGNQRKKLLKKVYVIPNAIDDFWINNCGNPKSEIAVNKRVINLIFAGRIDKNKNIETTQAAMNILNNNGIKCRLKIVGPVSEKDTFESIMKNKNTVYLEKQPKEELIHEYRESDVFVMPSFTETFGLVYVEAMSQGLPVVYSKGQGFDGFFEEGEIGFSSDSSSAESVAKAIQNCLRGYSERSTRCIEKAKYFNWENISNRYADVFLNCLNT